MDPTERAWLEAQTWLQSSSSWSMAPAAGVAASCMSEKGLNMAEGLAELQVDMDAGDCMSASPCCCCRSSGVVSLLHVRT